MRMNKPILFAVILAILFILVLLFGSSNKYEGFSEGVTTMKNSSLNTAHQGSSNIQGNAAVHHGNTAAHHGNTAVHHGNTAVHHGNTTAHHGNTAAHHGNTAAHHGNTAVHHVNTTAHKNKVNDTTHKGNTVVFSTPSNLQLLKGLFDDSTQLDNLSQNIKKNIINHVLDNNTEQAKTNSIELLKDVENVHDQLLQISNTL
jgi:hypothetical protein